jgi:hypothetical protein
MTLVYVRARATLSPNLLPFLEHSRPFPHYLLIQFITRLYIHVPI